MTDDDCDEIVHVVIGAFKFFPRLIDTAYTTQIYFMAPASSSLDAPLLLPSAYSVPKTRKKTGTSDTDSDSRDTSSESDSSSDSDEEATHRTPRVHQGGSGLMWGIVVVLILLFGIGVFIYFNPLSIGVASSTIQSSSDSSVGPTATSAAPAAPTASPNAMSSPTGNSPYQSSPYQASSLPTTISDPFPQSSSDGSPTESSSPTSSPESNTTSNSTSPDYAPTSVTDDTASATQAAAGTNLLSMTGVSWNSAVETASSVPGFQGTNGPGIGSWFHTDSTEDSTNGHSWCYFPYYDDNPGFAPDLTVMMDGFDTNELAGAAYCGLEALVTAPNGNQMLLYILDAFDPAWVKEPGSIDIIYDAFIVLNGASPGTDKDTVMSGVTWELTGNRLVAGTFNNGGLGSKRLKREMTNTTSPSSDGIATT